MLLREISYPCIDHLELSKPSLSLDALNCTYCISWDPRIKDIPTEIFPPLRTGVALNADIGDAQFLSGDCWMHIWDLLLSLKSEA